MHTFKHLNAVLTKNPHRTFKPKELAKKVGIKESNYPKFRDALKKLAAEGKIAKYKRNQYGLISKARIVEGEINIKTAGYAFLLTADGQDDIFISRKNIGSAFDKDTIRVQVYPKSQGRSEEGRVIEVVKRAKKKIIGTYRRNRKNGFIVPDDSKVPNDIIIRDEDSLDAKNGQKVAVTIHSNKQSSRGPEGKIVEILGFADKPGVDVLSIVKSLDLPTTFPKKVISEANKIVDEIPQEELDRRLDLREDTCFTIDPEDAKDFDDAVSIEILSNGNFELGVHIADVSYFVQEGNGLDKEALSRGTSIYLVDRVIPMLPEKISNQICSLRPDEDKLTFSCIMEVTPKGKIVNYKISESVIRSKRRFSYEEVQQIIETKNSKKPFANKIYVMHKLSQTLIKQRLENGGLDFDLPEVKVQLDDKGVPISIQRRERKDSHRLIEEFMLLANRTVTEHITKKLRQKLGRSLPFIFRIHEPPDVDKMDDFQKFVRTLGYPFDPNKKVTAKLLGDYLKSLHGKPEEVMVEGLLLRSMMKAKYSVDNAGHFGLAFKHYTHFTSPIRRYPDLAVHRLLKEYKNGFDFNLVKAKKQRVANIAKIASERELVALEAERKSIKLKKVEYMQRHLGDEFEGIISGVVAFGIFVEINDLLIDGLVHVSDFDDDYYIYDEKGYQFVGENSQKKYRLGDSVKVRVVRADVDKRVVDFTLVNQN